MGGRLEWETSGDQRAGIRRTEEERGGRGQGPGAAASPRPRIYEPSPGGREEEFESCRDRQDTESWCGSISCGRPYAEYKTFLT